MNEDLRYSKYLYSPIIPCVLLLIFRLSDLFTPYYNIDELTNTLFARFISEGRMTFYEWLGNTYLYTHYLYAFAYKLGTGYDLFPMRFIHILWCCATSVSLYYAGKLLTDNKQGGFWASMFYFGISLSFMSKDYRPPLAESLSLLPLSLACLFFLKAIKANNQFATLLAAFFVGIASLFKAPAGIIIMPIFVIIILFRSKRIQHFVCAGFGLSLGVFSPFLFVDDLSKGIAYMFGNLDSTMQYINYYNNLPFIYYLVKYFIRVGLIAISFPLASIFIVMTFRSFVYHRDINRNIHKKEELIFLILGLFCMGGIVVNIGNRIFYHYFVFTIPFAALIAAYSFDIYWRKTIKKYQRKQILLLVLAFFIPVIGYSVESMTGFSTQRKEFPSVVEFIKKTTNQSDKIFIWGNLPQIYFESNREPASTFFWSDALAGISPGSPTMEYMLGSDEKIRLKDTVVKDLIPSRYTQSNPNILEKGSLIKLREQELISDSEILAAVDNRYWKKVFEDFKATPPELFLDAASTGVKGFSKYPLENYEILKRYIEKHYHYERTINRVVIYRRN